MNKMFSHPIAFNKLKIAFNSKLTIKNKIRIFNAYIESIFLYNAELWTLTKKKKKKKKKKKLAEDINIFQRSLLRKIFKIAWPKKISNKDLYSKTKTVEWSKKIRKRRLLWIGYLFRLPEDVPTKQALAEDIRKVKRPRGKPKTTWLGAVQKKLHELNLTLENAKVIAQAQCCPRETKMDRYR